jgi:PAS domain S-box-containing protein
VSGPNQSTPSHDALLSAIIDSTPDAVLSTDLEGRITSWNRAATQLYGYDDSQAVGASFSMLFPRAEDADKALERVAAGERIEHQEAERLTADGDVRMVGETTSPVLDGDGAVVGAATISRDISDRLAIERALADAAVTLESEQARLRELNEELQRFVYVASHDLSEPLRTVAGMVGLLRRRYRGQLDAEADEFIDFAVAGCARTLPADRLCLEVTESALTEHETAACALAALKDVGVQIAVDDFGNEALAMVLQQPVLQVS